MKFWVFNGSDAIGPFDADEIRRRVPEFGPGTLVAPDGATDQRDWKPASEFQELTLVISAAAPPLSMPSENSPRPKPRPSLPREKPKESDGQAKLTASKPGVPLSSATLALIELLRQELGADPSIQTGDKPRSLDSIVLDSWGYQVRSFPIAVCEQKEMSSQSSQWDVSLVAESAETCKALTGRVRVLLTTKAREVLRHYGVDQILVMDFSPKMKEQEYGSKLLYYFKLVLLGGIDGKGSEVTQTAAVVSDPHNSNCPKCSTENHIDAISCQKCGAGLPVRQDPATQLANLQECLDRGQAFRTSLLEIYPSVLENVIQHLRRWYYRRDAHKVVKPRAFMPAVVLVTTVKAEHESLEIKEIYSRSAEPSGWGKRSGFASPSDYRATTRTYHLDDSEGSFQCGSCAGSGYIPCAIQESCCSNRDCFQCHGSGHRSCSTCNGSGRRHCWSCSGGTVYYHRRVVVKHWPETIRFAWVDPSSEDWAKTLPAKVLLTAQGDKLFDAGGPLPQMLIAMVQQSAVSGLVAKNLQQFVEALKPYLERLTPAAKSEAGNPISAAKAIRLTHTTVNLVPIWKVGYEYKGRSGHFLIVGKERRVLRRWQWPMMHWPRIMGATALACSLLALGVSQFQQRIVATGRLRNWSIKLLSSIEAHTDSFTSQGRRTLVPPGKMSTTKSAPSPTQTRSRAIRSQGTISGSKPETKQAASVDSRGKEDVRSMSTEELDQWLHRDRSHQ